MVSAGGIFDLLLVFWIWGVAVAVGTRLLNWVKLEPGNKLEWLALSSAVGLSILSLTVMVLGGLKLLHPGAAYAILLTGSIGLWPAWKYALQQPEPCAEARSQTDCSPRPRTCLDLDWRLSCF